ncbi:glycoside hydrolase family 47 protein [Rhypophila decipiens]
MVPPWSTASVLGLLVLGQSVTGASIPNTPWKQRLQERAEQYHGPSRPYVENPSRAAAVRKTFDISWDGYYKYAFPHDSLRPGNNSWYDDRNGWGASAVDALSTALIMRDALPIAQILDHIRTINFDNTTTEVSLFETTIRYLGGLISGTHHLLRSNLLNLAYDLLTGPLADIYGFKENFTVILDQATRLADNLAIAFFTATGIPDNSLRWNPPRPAGSSTNGIATIGTLVLEWTRLSDLTGNPRYGLLAQRGEDYLIHPRNPDVGEPFPGLLGTNVGIHNGTFVDSSGGWGGSDDSFYEYLIKMYLYDPVRFEEYKERWIDAAESSIAYLVSHPTSRADLTFLAMWDNATSLNFVSEHLACFNGGNFILGGLTLDEPRYVQFGLMLVESCHETYTATATGIGPEVFRWRDSMTPFDAINNAPPPANQSAFYDANGFWIQSSYYVLRPEVVESIYYAYRATGDPKYQEWAWNAFLAVNKTCATGSGYSTIRDVNKPDGGGFTNFQESFWFAEVLKYSYLIHAPESPWQVKADHTNEFVFNTEAHPVRIFGGSERTANR